MSAVLEIYLIFKKILLAKGVGNSQHFACPPVPRPTQHEAVQPGENVPQWPLPSAWKQRGDCVSSVLVYLGLPKALVSVSPASEH